MSVTPFFFFWFLGFTSPIAAGTLTFPQLPGIRAIPELSNFDPGGPHKYLNRIYFL